MTIWGTGTHWRGEHWIMIYCKWEKEKRSRSEIAMSKNKGKMKWKCCNRSKIKMKNVEERIQWKWSEKHFACLLGLHTHKKNCYLEMFCVEKLCTCVCVRMPFYIWHFRCIISDHCWTHWIHFYFVISFILTFWHPLC